MNYTMSGSSLILLIFNSFNIIWLLNWLKSLVLHLFSVTFSIRSKDLSLFLYKVWPIVRMKRNFEFTALVDNAIFNPAWPPNWTEGKIIPSISVLLIISEEIVAEIRYSLLSVTTFENSLLIKRIRSFSWSVKRNFLNTSLVCRYCWLSVICS